VTPFANRRANRAGNRLTTGWRHKNTADVDAKKIWDPAHFSRLFYSSRIFSQPGHFFEISELSGQNRRLQVICVINKPPGIWGLSLAI